MKLQQTVAVVKSGMVIPELNATHREGPAVTTPGAVKEPRAEGLSPKPLPAPASQAASGENKGWSGPAWEGP